MPSVDELGKLYFRFGFKNKEILSLLTHNCTGVITIAILRRLCQKKLHIFRRKKKTCKLRGGGCLRASWNGGKWTNARISIVEPSCSPEGTGCVARHCETIDQVIWSWRCGAQPRGDWDKVIIETKVPNVRQHMDSYDKLKPCGITIKGCTHGFRCDVVQMEAYGTNNNPKVFRMLALSKVLNLLQNSLKKKV